MYKNSELNNKILVEMLELHQDSELNNETVLTFYFSLLL